MSSAYEIIAICNTSVESSARSTEFHKFDPSTVKAYGSAEDIALDPDVDHVVVVVSAKYHMLLAKPAINAGKDVYVEFPVAPTVAECEELSALAKRKGVKAIVGTQAFSDPFMTKLRETLPEVGDVISTELTGATPLDVSIGWPENASGFLELESEVSRIAIVLGHVLGGFSSVVGNFDDLQSVYKTQTGTTTLLDASYQPSKLNHPVTAPDHMLIQGVLKSGATASINIRTSATPIGDVGFRWLISGTLAEIEVVTKPGFFQVGQTGAAVALRKRNEQNDQVIEWESEDAASVAGIEGMEQSIDRAYAAFAESQTADYATFETALGTHCAMDKATKNALGARG